MKISIWNVLSWVLVGMLLNFYFRWRLKKRFRLSRPPRYLRRR
jgi:hypothetical protein